MNLWRMATQMENMKRVGKSVWLGGMQWRRDMRGLETRGVMVARSETITWAKRALVIINI